MSSRRTLLAASFASLAVAVAGLLAPSATAEDLPAMAPGGFRGLAEGTALDLDLLGQQLTIGLPTTGTDSTPAASSRAVGALLPGLGLVGEETASAIGGDSTDGDDQPTCGPLELPAIPAVDLAVACGQAFAAIQAGLPLSRSSAGVATLSVSATELLQDTPLSQLPVEATVEQVLGGLAPVFEVVEQLGLDADSLVTELLAGITQGGQLLTVELGPSATQTLGDAAAVTTSSTAAGAVIRVIDRSLLSLPPVLTIEVGAAGASVAVDRTSGVATPTIDPALVRVTVAEDIALILGLADNVIEVAPGTDLCIPLPAPLESCITVAGGRVTDTTDGGKRAESEGVGLRLLTGLPDGGIVLGLAAASAEAAALAPAPAAPAPAPEEPRTAPTPALARTGGAVSMLPATLLGATALAGLALVASSRRRNSI